MDEIQEKKKRIASQTIQSFFFFGIVNWTSGLVKGFPFRQYQRKCTEKRSEQAFLHRKWHEKKKPKATRCESDLIF